MARRYVRVVVYKKSASSWSSTATEITNVRNVVIKRGINKVKDTFEFELTNTHNQYYNTVGYDDRCTIWVWNNTPWSNLTQTQRNDALQIDGVVTDFQQDFMGGGRVLKIKGVGFKEVIAKGLVFVRSPDIVKPHLLIQNVLTQLNNTNPYRKIYGANPAEWATLSNPTTKAGGDDFDDVQYTTSYKSGLEVIDDLSSDKYTNDGAYTAKVTYNPTTDRYEFIWRAKTRSTSLKLTEGTTDMNNLKLKQNKDKVVNAIIYNVGFDCNDIAWEFLHFEPSEMVSGGAQWLYYTETNTVIPRLIQQEYDNNRSLWEQTTEGKRKENYPKDSSYTYTMQFKARDENGEYTGSNLEVDNDDEFNDAIVNEAEWVGRDQVSKVLERFGTGKWEGDVLQPQTETIIEGDLVEIDSVSYGFTGTNTKLIRCIEMYNDVWKTTLMLEEDERSVITEQQ